MWDRECGLVAGVSAEGKPDNRNRRILRKRMQIGLFPVCRFIGESTNDPWGGNVEKALERWYFDSGRRRS